MGNSGKSKVVLVNWLDGDTEDEVEVSVWVRIRKAARKRAGVITCINEQLSGLWVSRIGPLIGFVLFLFGRSAGIERGSDWVM